MMKIKVWEPVIRIFHWLLMALVMVAMLTSFWEDLLKIHLLAGQGIGVLLVFRIGWGFLGNEYARFAEFIKSPKVVFHHLRQMKEGKNPRYLGHNPMAGWWMMIMLLVLMVILYSGLVLMGGQERIGLLAEWFTQDEAYGFHSIHEVLAYVIMAMAAVHVGGAILESLHQKENLVASMLHGNKDQRENQPAPKATLHKLGRTLFLGLILGFGIWLYQAWPLDYRSVETLNADQEKTSEAYELYIEECGSCHFEFSANLLPQRSWVVMMADLENHFGDDASLDEEDQQTLGLWLQEGALETSQSEWPYLIGKSILPEDSPQRISKTSYWIEKHEDIEESITKRKSVRSKLNCGACHPNAAYGSYEDARIEIPKDRPKT